MLIEIPAFESFQYLMLLALYSVLILCAVAIGIVLIVWLVSLIEKFEEKESNKHRG